MQIGLHLREVRTSRCSVRTQFALVYYRFVCQRIIGLVHHRLYQYDSVPPRIASGIRWPGVESLREWGVLPSPDSDECISLQHLDEFKSTGFQVVARPCGSSSREPAKRRLPEAPLCRRGMKRVLESEPLFPKPVKRPKLITSSIVDLLPQVSASLRCP